MVMVLWGMVAWWYTVGWRQCWLRAQGRLEATIDFFSIGLLINTFFSPFRQISAGQVNGSLDARMHAFLDRLISRFIGSTVRLLMIFIGSITIIVHFLVGMLLTVGWFIVPLLPLIGLVLFVSGWLPWNN